jgi:UDP-3-O-[3-hydroxymyristoyl] glucosamine N-acyltransferase
VGNRVVLHSGAVIGSDGFGFARESGEVHKIPQIGCVVLEDDVEIGANVCIDRATVGRTVIAASAKIDNLVQIGHNVRVGRGCVIVAQAGISGSTILEDHVVLAAQAGLTGHLRIGRGVRIGAQAGVISDLPAGVEVVGSPAQPRRAFFREVAVLRRLVRDRGRRPKETDPGTDSDTG